ncbi:MAG TPA: GNAT family N-acetyltransferase [Streptosporangiaceae bacterium]|jgi:enoyl-CoA hydratase/carnithine racemase/GNAT superfamily N-acetyltransferase|nr:GNAT family N-acetyltransferase [Streptosporangiaceae bacterium]
MTTAATHTLEPVDALDATGVAEVRRIYEDGFPSHQRAEFSAVTDRRQAGELALALICGGQAAGFALLRPLGGTGWVFLRYFVVDGRVRGQGLGGIMWDALTARLRADGHTLLVFDVEDPDEPGCDPAQARVRSRRIAFYQRHGAGVLPVRGYRMPHENGAITAWHPMLLMAAPLDTGGRVADPDRARGIVTAVYRYRWALDSSHHQVAAVRVDNVPVATVQERTGGKGRDVSVDYELREPVAWIYLNRPHRLNAVVPELTAGLVAGLDRARREGARVAVLAGRGRAFCSGHDLKEPVPPETVLATRLRVDGIQDVTRAIRRFPGPVVAAVHGYALGAGCEFALGCDLVVAAEDAQFGFPEVSVGLSVTGGISRLLPLLVGPVRAKELLLLGERFGAARALEFGLVNRVVPAGEHERAAAGIADRLADQPALALALAKQALDRGADCALEEAMATEVDLAALTVAPGAAGNAGAARAPVAPGTADGG